MTLNTSIQDHLESTLSDHFARKVSIRSIHPVGGGSINRAYQLKTTAGDLFLKHNSASGFPGMFQSEKVGLEFLRNNSGFIVPDTYFSTQHKDDSLLVMEYIHKGQPGKNFFEEMGKLLANLHRKTNDLFGLDHNNYIGSLAQSNTPHRDWSSFFAEERLGKQLQLAEKNDRLDRSTCAQFEKLYKKLDAIFPKEPPALLHGDLWSGNFMADRDGHPCVYDPAVYYGHREMDIAMTKLFGGFDDEFYKSYNENYPMEKGWEERLDICNLYPLMVHVNLFGGGYAEDVKQILRRFV